MSSYISRTLVWTDEQGESHRIADCELLSLNRPIVILGEPGMGKTELLQHLQRENGLTFFSVAKWLRTASPPASTIEDKPVLIDALDEASGRRDGDAIEAVLEKLGVAGFPPFILSCRAVDWEARGKTSIEEDYRVPPAICNLQPFDLDDALKFLGENFPAADASGLLENLRQQNLLDLAGNPLTLGLLGRVAEAPGALPSSRAALFERATELLWREHNDRHSGSELDSLSEHEALDAAGAICAALLLSGLEVITKAGAARVQNNELRVVDVARLPATSAAETILSSKLFRVESEARIMPIHRVIAEFLGARWLARQARNHRQQRRLFSRLHSAGAVPARIRGLHAWLAHHSSAMAPAVIAFDPYGMLRYGDTGGLALDHAHLQLTALEELTERDPLFRSGDWNSHPLAGLMRVELASRIADLIVSQDTNEDLRSLLIEGIPRTVLASHLAATLESEMLNPGLSYHERESLVEARLPHRDAVFWAAQVDMLRGLADEDSTRLSLHIIQRLGPAIFDDALIVSAVFADAKLTVSTIPRSHPRPMSSSWYLLHEITVDRVPGLLDLAAEYAELTLTEDMRPRRTDIADFIMGLIARAIEAEVVGPSDHSRVWRWLSSLRHAISIHRNFNERLEQRFKANHLLRRAIQSYVMFDLRPKHSVEQTAFLAFQRIPGLYPDGEDLCFHLSQMAEAPLNEAQNREDWKSLVDLARPKQGIDAPTVAAAKLFARSDAKLLRVISRAEKARPDMPWEKKQRIRTAKAARKRATQYAVHRSEFVTHRDQMRAGEFEWLFSPAQGYLNRFTDFDTCEGPIQRLDSWLGEDLRNEALIGFEAYLWMTNLPSPIEVSEALAAHIHQNTLSPIFAGLLERLRTGKDLNDLPREVLLSALLAHNHNMGSRNGEKWPDLRSALKSILIVDAEEFESYQRLLIEPQLARRNAHIEGLFEFTHTPEYPHIVAKLAEEWLQAHAELPHAVEIDLIDALIQARGMQAVRDISRARAPRVLASVDEARAWWSIDWLTDFERFGAAMSGIAGDHEQFLFNVRDRLGRDRRQITVDLSVDQLKWAIEEFRTVWPNIPRPTGGTEGTKNAWDASDLVKSFIYQLARKEAPAATEVFRRIIAAVQDTYSADILHAAAEQEQKRSEIEFQPMTVENLAATLKDGPPGSIDELRALVLEEIADEQRKLRGSDTDRVAVFWKEPGKPESENWCRDRFAELISPYLERYRIIPIPERDMPESKRADLAFGLGNLQLPMEIKGQWHNDVWDAAAGQLDALYLRDWRSQGKGQYLVLWFGDVERSTGRALKPPPNNIRPPSRPDEMRTILISRLPADRRHAIDVVVLDLTRN